jgi:hypothetical protein
MQGTHMQCAFIFNNTYLLLPRTFTRVKYYTFEMDTSIDIELDHLVVLHLIGELEDVPLN